MSFEQMPRKALALLSALMILAGLALAAWSLSNLPIFDNHTPTTGAVAQSDEAAPVETQPTPPGESQATATAAVTEAATAAETGASTPPVETPSPAPTSTDQPNATQPIAVTLVEAPPALQDRVFGKAYEYKADTGPYTTC